MMARLLDEVPRAATTPPGSMCEVNKSPHVSTRKPSFKTKQAGARGVYRATKVNLSSTNVALIASKFNTIVVDDEQSRALLRKLSSTHRKPSAAKDVKTRAVKTRGDGVVKAAIELFEHQESEKLNYKLPSKKGLDSRMKLVVVRKSSSKASARGDDSSKADHVKSASDQLKQSAKDSVSKSIKYSDSKKSPSKSDEKIEVKRKPSLKAKPILRQSETKQTQNPLSQRIDKIPSIDKTTKLPDKVVLKKPNFSLSERIAQFSKTKEDKNLDSKPTNNKIIPNKLSIENKKNLSSNLEEKENKKVTFIANSTNQFTKQSSLVEQTKNRLTTEVQTNNLTTLKSKPPIGLNNKKTLANDKNMNDKDVKVYNGDISSSNKLSLKEITLPDVVKTSIQSKHTVSAANTCTYAALSFQQDNEESEIIVNKAHDTVKPTADSESKNFPSKDSAVKLKSVLRPISSESPKLEKKVLSLAPEPYNDLEIEKIKPNNSFLWKPAGKINVITEVPIYDDRPISRVNEVFLQNKDKNVSNYEKSDLDDSTKSPNSLELDVASSFILEMTEQIDRRFSSSSSQDKDFDNVSNLSDEVETAKIPENQSFLHRKISNDDVFSKKADTSEIKSKPLLTRTSKTPPPIGKKPAKPTPEDTPPQLPEKLSKSSGKTDKTEPSPPPIPPSHTKPKLTLTLSEEEWLENCKKILELPPPKRLQENHTAKEAQLETTSTPTSRVSSTERPRTMTDKRFSVSQMDLLRRMDEMNLGNKRNSLPPDGLESYSSLKNNEEEDHYSTIPAYKTEDEDQDTYEAIGENNYAEIKEYDADVDEEGENSNIYDDVNSHEQEPEDHYEAINCALVQGQDSDSSCDQSNSLYGLRPPSIAATGGLYQGTPGSETSDDWVDLDNSDDQNDSSIYILREKERGRGLIATESWSMKVRRQWNKQAANDDGSDNVPKAYENVNNVDEVQDFDDFDSLSDSSFDESNDPQAQQMAEEKKVEPVSEGIYGLMKQAGQRMRKHWSIGKSLTRMRKNKSVPTISIPTTVSISRRGWSFKSKEKPSSAQSTFYLHSNTLSRTDAKLEKKLDPRRMSTASIVARPTSPPPPPPPRNSIYETKRRSDVINLNNSGDSESYIEGQRSLSRNGNSLWYVDSTSADSTSDHGSSQGSDLNLRFADEPLYQFYAANIQNMAMSDMVEDTDGYEEITPSTVELPPSALDLVSSTHHRSLWCDVPQVRNSGVLDSMSQAQKRLQEAKFEVMTSEASYFKSLTVLDKLFASCPLFCDENILSREEKKVLFGNVTSVRKCSEKLLLGLQASWQDCILMPGICEIVDEHVQTYRDTYVNYCTNQISMDRTLKALKASNSNFSAVLTQLESDAECQSLTLYSFLMLPMQRITRLRLLIETMLSLIDTADSEHSVCQRTLLTLNKCVAECNEGARSQERLEEMVRLSRQLEFPPEICVPILGEGRNRWLVRSGQVTQVNMDAKHTFGRRLSRTGPKFTLFLFTDLFIFTKKKSEDCYNVFDHCQRSLVETREMNDFPGNNRFLIQVTLLENAEKKTVEMTLSCENETDRQRWLQVLTVPQSEDGETLYEDWDCPQVSVVHGYQPSQPDELNLAMGDIINVLRKSEGWFYGERTRDGEKGWFPGNYTRELASKHMRARNLKQRHRLLQLSADFVQQQRKVKS